MRRSGRAGSRPSSVAVAVAVAVAEMSRFPIYKKLLSKSFKYIGKRDICVSHPGDHGVERSGSGPCCRVLMLGYARLCSIRFFR